MIKRTGMAILCVAIAAGCGESDFPAGPFERPSERVALAGFWSGTAEVTGERDMNATLGMADRTRSGYAYPVAIQFQTNGWFQLWSPVLPVTGTGPDASRYCSGAFSARSGSVSFYPDGQCRALPLQRYTIGRFGPNGLMLEAATGGVAGQPGGDMASIRVIIRVERD
jgi:hypothetical protein